ncbi:MAG TPA: hypothetical protein VG323_22720, partial [Thermoanaerobaculia bacterium]|nr:hypothetical protein [Thermoanaerobaculia bacterium]
MNRQSSTLTVVVVAFALLLISSVAFAAPLPDYRGDRISTQGTVTSMTRVGDQVRVELNHGSYAYFVPVSMVSSRDIRIGDQVRIGGTVNGDSVNADYIAFSGEPTYA